MTRTVWYALWTLLAASLMGSPCLATMLAPPGVQLRAEQVPSAAERRYNVGLEALETGNLEMARSEFQASIELQSNWSAPHLGLAEVALRRKQFADAEAILRQALKTFPNDATVYTAWGRYSLAQGNTREAEVALTKAVQLAPSAIEPLLELGGLYSNALRRPADAISAFEAAIRLQPRHAGAHHGLGMALVMAGKPDAAVTELRRAAELAPGNPLPRHALGRVLVAQGKPEEALKAYSEALRLQPGFIPSRLDRAYIYMQRGAWQNARDDFAQVVAQAPANIEAQMGLGMTAQQLQELDVARKAYRAVLTADPKRSMAYNNLAWVEYELNGADSDALKWAREAVRLSAETADFQDTLGWLLHLQGKNAEARPILEKAAALESKPYILYHLGRVQAELGHHQQARELVSRALAMDAHFDGAEDARAMLNAQP